jgi:hypothetical protein
MLAPDVLRLPREANREVAALIDARTGAQTRVYGRIKDPGGLDFYLDRPLSILPDDKVVSRVCNSDHELVYVMQPWAIADVAVPCLGGDGVEHFRFEQYTRGHEIDVWLVPPAA